MKILIGTGNAVTCTFSASAKTLAFAGAYNFDITPQSLQVYNTTRSAFMYGGDTSATTGVTITGGVTTYTAGLPIQTFTLSAVPGSSADGDTLVIFCECPDSIAIYNATVTT